MKAVFADTFFWVALLNTNDSRHNEVTQWLAHHQNMSIVTTDEVVIEMLNAFSGKGSHFRKIAGQYATSIITGGIFDVKPQSRHSLQEGLTLYLSRLDKGYSLTDYISMTVMRRQSISDVLTKDVHFTQEGYVALFK